MATEAQIAANQANVQLSTGPKTEEGKAASSKNHLSHGLTYRGGTFVLLPWEDGEEFNNLVLDLKCEYTPKNRTEMILVERMASTTGYATAPPCCKATASKTTVRSTTNASLCTCAMKSRTSAPSTSV